MVIFWCCVQSARQLAECCFSLDEKNGSNHYHSHIITADDEPFASLQSEGEDDNCSIFDFNSKISDSIALNRA